MKQRRCLRREFRLRPDRLVVQIFLYTLAHAANKYGILLHDFVALSNHDHLVLTDPHTKRPAFLQLFHSLIARAVNAAFGEWDALWSAQPYSAPRLLEPEDVLRKLVYTLANPVAAGLVRYCKDWEGPTSWNMEYGVPIRSESPALPSSSARTCPTSSSSSSIALQVCGPTSAIASSGPSFVNRHAKRSESSSARWPRPAEPSWACAAC